MASNNLIKIKEKDGQTVVIFSNRFGLAHNIITFILMPIASIKPIMAIGLIFIEIYNLIFLGHTRFPDISYPLLILPLALIVPWNLFPILAWFAIIKRQLHKNILIINNDKLKLISKLFREKNIDEFNITDVTDLKYQDNKLKFFKFLGKYLVINVKNKSYILSTGLSSFEADQILEKLLSLKLFYEYLKDKGQFYKKYFPKSQERV